ncbi:MAG: chromate transporter [Oscillospiraceae bacterium]|nr:chromate transporter [Oscillospiraceae bacterium]
MKKNTLSKAAELFAVFFKIGLFTFGGGYAMISLITATCVEEKHWLSSDEMLNLTVVAESTPGPIAINCATFVGYRRGGLPGSIAATLGVVMPSFFIIALISRFLEGFLQIRWIASAFRGIRACVGVLILDVGWKMAKKMKKDPLPLSILVTAAAAMLIITLTGIPVSSVALMLMAGFVSLTVYLAGQKGGSA